MKPLKLAFLLPAILLSTGALSHAATLVPNGDFTAAGSSAPGTTPPTITDWTYAVSDSTDDYSTYQTTGGATAGPSPTVTTVPYAELGTYVGYGDPRSFTSDSFAVTAGTSYNESFDYASDTGSTYSGEIIWRAADSSIISVSNSGNLSSISGLGGPTWSLYSSTVSAPIDAVSGTFQFNGNFGNGFADLDNVNLSPATVPEPNMISLMGLALAGFVVLRRRMKISRS